MSLVIELRQGSKLIATRNLELTPEMATYELNLTAAERKMITRWDTLRLHFIANPDDKTQIAWAEFSAPKGV
jgi:hypothetical protein